MQNLKNKLKFLPELGLILATIWLRVVNLGYSDYQGDEIKALFLPQPDQRISNFLLTQRKGPLQFIITFLVKLIDPTYSHRLLLRAPFALAGIFAVFFFYKFIKLHFSRKIALYASFFMATNGFLIAFSRIVQYQSFVVLFMILALYVFSLAVTDQEWKFKGLYLGFIFWALSILAHYDGILIAPFVVYLGYKWLKQYSINLRNKHIVLSGLIFCTLLATFYIPFVLELSAATKDYWQNRISGGSGKVSSSRYLFQVYHPIYVIHAYTALAILGGIAGMLRIVKTKLRWLNFAPDVSRVPYIFLVFWVVVPLVFLEILVNIPGTHIYTYLIPLMILMAFGIVLLENFITTIFGKLTSHIVSSVGICIAFCFMFLQSNAVFVDHFKEYPWEHEKFLIWEFRKPSPVFHLSMFGFPYYRHWDEIGSFVRSSENNGYYSTNERKSIARYHIPFQKDSTKAGHFVHIVNPQSFTNDILSEKPKYWASKYEPILVFIKDGKEIAKVYYMPKGTLAEIQNAGY